MVGFKLGTTLATIGFAFALSQAPAYAASPMTEAFLSNVAANLAILDTSSHLAQDHSRTADLVAYAGSEERPRRRTARSRSPRRRLPTMSWPRPTQAR